MGTTNRPPARTVITCTKSEFRARLVAEFPDGMGEHEAPTNSELAEVIEGLVRQAEQRGGAYSGYNAYLDLDFTATPDEAPAKIWPTANEIRANHDALNTVDSPDEQITIPAVTDAQRDEARDSAYATAHHAVRVLRRQLDIGQLNPETFDQLGDALKAAAGHLRIANGEN